MKKMHLAQSDTVLMKLSIPDIKVTDASSSEKNGRSLEPKLVENGPNLMVVPTSHVDLTSHHHPLKVAQSHHHAPSIAEQGKHVYHSEPANLNGSVPPSPELLYSSL